RAVAPPAATLLRGHGLLTLNENNDSLCAFSGLIGQDDVAMWETWTRSFSSRHSENPVSHYLHGDALARQGNWDAAISESNRALALDPNHALSLNARGVVQTIRGQYDVALLAARGSSLEFEIAVSEYSRCDLSIPADLRADSGFQNLPEALNNSN